MGLKFCANLSFLFHDTQSLLDKYVIAKQAGFKAVECAFPYEHSADVLAETKSNVGLQQILINTSPGDWSKGDRGLAAIPGREGEFKLSLEQAILYAKKLDCKRIHIMAGTIQKETPQNFQVYKKNLSYAVKLLHENDIVGLIEPINNYSVPSYFLNNYEKAVAVIEEINSPNLRLLLDFYHLQHIKGNLTKNLKHLIRFVGHVQIAQVPNRNEPNAPGEINYKYICSQLEKVNYNGWVGLEYNQTDDGFKWIQEFGYSL